MNKILLILHEMHIRPNHITIFGLFCSAVSAVMIASGEWFPAFLWLLASGLSDIMDGALARATNSSGVFGALFDSVCDRYSDAFSYIGFIAWCISNEITTGIFFAISALVGGFLVSYIRARGEGIGYECYEGFWERGERFVFFLAALGLHRLPQAVCILGVFVHFTAMKRVIFLKKQMSNPMPPKEVRSALKHRISKYRRLTFWLIAFTYFGLLFVIENPF